MVTGITDSIQAYRPDSTSIKFQRISGEISIKNRSAKIPADKSASGWQDDNSGIDNPSGISVRFERTEISADFSFYTKKGITPVKQDSVENSFGVQDSVSEVARLREQIHTEILVQIKSFMLGYFSEHPEALQQISNGEIPDYFNVDNTARRILDIYFVRYQEGEDKQAFVERAKGIINQAYSDVEGMVGTLPEIVQKTRDKVMEILDKFAGGGDISDFMQRTIK